MNSKQLHRKKKEMFQHLTKGNKATGQTFPPAMFFSGLMTLTQITLTPQSSSCHKTFKSGPEFCSDLYFNDSQLRKVGRGVLREKRGFWTGEHLSSAGCAHVKEPKYRAGRREWDIQLAANWRGHVGSALHSLPTHSHTQILHLRAWVVYADTLKSTERKKDRNNKTFFIMWKSNCIKIEIQ